MIFDLNVGRFVRIMLGGSSSMKHSVRRWQVCPVGEVLGARGKQWKLLSEFHSVQNGHWNKNSTAIKMDRENIN